MFLTAKGVSILATILVVLTVDAMRHALKRESSVPFYTRGCNPTIEQLNHKMAALEGAEAALSFGSGSAAVAAAVMANVQAGDHIVCVQKPYSWTYKLLTQIMARFGVESTFVDGQNPKNIEKAIRPTTKIVYLETPNSFTFELQDIRAIAKIAKKHHCITIVDNSYCTPMNQQPIQLGADIVVHSATKYISGHSDAVGGVLCASQAMVDKIFAGEFMTLGGIISPFNAWLMLRGLRTLPIRLKRVAKTTKKIVKFLEKHPQVEKIYYPFLPSHPQYKLAKKQMEQRGGLFSVVIKADLKGTELFCNSLQRFLMGASWGGYESLIYPACAMYDSANYSTTTLPYNIIRFYIGLEEPEVLLADLEQAFERIK
ncbi:MAG: trans-sulfuration enzyme family protein, partial [Thermoflexibacteraceae bacterium]